MKQQLSDSNLTSDKKTERGINQILQLPVTKKALRIQITNQTLCKENPVCCYLFSFLDSTTAPPPATVKRLP